jgi:glycosyltransferase involved in cell wall biosynthesis
MPDDRRATVAIVGAIGPDKGARRVEALAEEAGRIGAAVRFVVIGYTDRHHDAWQDDAARLTVHGRYDPRDLPALLDHYRARLVLFPSLGPETFAFTLSEVWAAGRAALVPPIGALADRVRDHDGGWIMTDAEWRDVSQLLERIVAIVAPANEALLAEAGRRASVTPVHSVEAMIGSTLDAYRAAMAGRTVDHPPVERLRVVEAYGYRRSTPQSDVDTGRRRASAVGRVLGARLRNALLSRRR